MKLHRRITHGFHERRDFRLDLFVGSEGGEVLLEVRDIGWWVEGGNERLHHLEMTLVDMGVGRDLVESANLDTQSSREVPLEHREMDSVRTHHPPDDIVRTVEHGHVQPVTHNAECETEVTWDILTT